MKKISTLLMLFCAFVSTAFAQLPTASTAPSEGKWAADTKWYTIKQNNTNAIALSNADGNGYLKLNSTTTKTLDGYWCVVGNDADGYQFYNLQAGTTQTLGAYGSEANGRMKMYDLDVTKDGSNTLTKTFDIKKLDGQDGYAFVKNHGSANDWWNERSGYLAYWNSSNACAANCTGSQYTFAEVDVTALVDEYKTNAKTALDMVSFLGVDDAKAAIDAVATTNCNAFAEIDAIVNGVAQYVAFRNGETDPNQNRINNYLAAYMPNSKGHGASSFNWKKATWSLKYSGEGSFYVYNVNENVYLGNPDSRGELTAVPKVAYTFEKIEDNKVELKCGGQTLHLNNHNGNGAVSEGNALTNHDGDDVASRWYVETDFAAHVATYKTTAQTTLDSWKTLSVVFDGAPIDEAKTAIGAIATTNYATFAAIDAELKKVTDVVAAKLFTFQCTDTSDAKRVNVYVAANASTGKAVGADNQDYNAIWTLQHAGGSSFYLYNELNKVYLGAPVNTSDAVVLTETPVAAYSFELIENNVVEMKCNGATLHASNHDDDKLINYDGDQAASRWYITAIDITAELQELIDANASNYAEVPVLGQYSKAGYDALKAAKGTVQTVKDVVDAIAAFKAAKNRPVFMITGVKDYVVGKSIYDDGVDAPNFKTTNAFDKTMWWALDMTETTVGVTEEVGIQNVGTGNGFWGVSSIKITETSDANTEDGIFLFYTTGNNNPIHYQNTNQVIVRYGDTQSTSASAHKFTYIGNSYDLAQLSDELFTAAAELAAVNVPNFSFAPGVNNYNEATKPALDAAIANRAEVLGELSTAEEIATAKTQLETAIDGVQLNMPVNGKFYRVRCTDEGMKRLQSTINSDRLQMIGGDAGINVNSIFCYVDGGLLSYTTGKYINAYNFDAVGTKSTVTFSKAYNGTLGQYNIKINDSRYIYGKKDEIDSGTGNPTDGGYNWWLEEVTTLPVTITEAGYATFYAPVALTLPAEVKAYTVTVNGASAMLNEIDGGVIPANTGVVLEGTADTYSLTVAESAPAIEDNDLLGTVAASYVTEDAYVLGYVGEDGNKEVGFYIATKNFNAEGEKVAENGVKWLNNGFKAYLPKPAGSGANALRFNFGGNTTAIESVLNGVDANAPIYDLSGRRVMNAVKGGIYIQNGKKFIVK